jgi:hypothetical protein
MEREGTIASDAAPTGGIDQSGATIKGAGKRRAMHPARLWRDIRSRWIGGSQDLSLALLARGGLDAPPAAARLDALKFPQSGHITATGKSGGANVTDCTTGGETCAPIS